ncbi:MAG: SufE family protein [Bacteroidales bacterium]|nr:SufE family protein [Bacteroidales bacterium]MBN2764638.1 SufE family protein [Bacteroidales bacterium]
MDQKNTTDIQEDIINEFEMYDDWMDKYNYIIELSRDMPVIDVKQKINANLINGCQSKVWLTAEYDNGKVVFYADSDAVITKGIITLLIRVLSKRTPDEILDTDLYFIDRIGLRQNLSPTRSNGLLAMVKQMRLYALAYKTKYGPKPVN